MLNEIVVELSGAATTADASDSAGSTAVEQHLAQIADERSQDQARIADLEVQLRQKQKELDDLRSDLEAQLQQKDRELYDLRTMRTNSGEPAQHPAPDPQPGSSSTDVQHEAHDQQPPIASTDIPDEKFEGYFTFEDAQSFIDGLPGLLASRGVTSLTRSIEQEFRENELGKWYPEFEYVAYEAAREGAVVGGKEPKGTGTRDAGHAGMTIDDFLRCPDSQSANLTQAELVMLRSYTGPPFKPLVKWLRFGKPEDESWATSVAVLYSAVLKLSRLQRSATVYRGVREDSLLLPESFLQPSDGSVAGGVEKAFSSTTKNRAIAQKFADKDGDPNGSGKGTIFELDFSMTSAGGSLLWLSQYPVEDEILFPPCISVTMVPGQDLRFDGNQKRYLKVVVEVPYKEMEFGLPETVTALPPGLLIDPQAGIYARFPDLPGARDAMRAKDELTSVGRTVCALDAREKLLSAEVVSFSGRRETKVQDSDWASLLHVLSDSTKVRMLLLQDLQLNDGGGLLLKALQRLPSSLKVIQVINTRGYPRLTLGADCLGPIAIKMMRSNAGSKVCGVNLQCLQQPGHLDDLGMCVLASILAQPNGPGSNLEELHLTCGSFGKTGIEALAAVLPRLPQLRVLDLSRSHRFRKLSILTWKDCKRAFYLLDEDALSSLPSALERTPQLCSLNLSGNGLGSFTPLVNAWDSVPARRPGLRSGPPKCIIYLLAQRRCICIFVPIFLLAAAPTFCLISWKCSRDVDDGSLAAGEAPLSLAAVLMAFMFFLCLCLYCGCCTLCLTGARSYDDDARWIADATPHPRARPRARYYAYEYE